LWEQRILECLFFLLDALFVFLLLHFLGKNAVDRAAILVVRIAENAYLHDESSREVSPPPGVASRQR
jgi:hypothetical protein